MVRLIKEKNKVPGKKIIEDLGRREGQERPLH